MKHPLFVCVVMAAALVGAVPANAQMMGWRNSSVSQEVYEHTVREEAEGKELWTKLQEKQVACASLSDENFAALGEYFMGQMTGTAHPAMNAMMIQMHDEAGEEQIHIAMGKRLSGCNPAAVIPQVGAGWMPMMGMMWGGWSSPFWDGSTGWSWGGQWLFMLPSIIWSVVGILAVIWLWKRIDKK